MSTLQETINSLYLLCGTILLTTGYFLYRAVDFKSKTINPVFWFAAFSGLYLAGGGLRTLVAANAESLEALFWNYAISNETVQNCFLPWFIFCAAIILLEYYFPMQIDLELFKTFTQSLTGAKTFKVFSLFFAPLALFSFFSGGIGYMGQTVGTESSAYEVNPFFSIIYLLLLAYVPLLAIFASFSSFNTWLWLLLGILAILSISLGRRIFLSLAITLGGIYIINNPGALKSIKLVLFFPLVFVSISFAFSIFYGFRMATWELSQLQTERSFLYLAPKALENAFSSDRLIAQDFEEQKKENVVERPFTPLAYYIFVVNLFRGTNGYKGELLLANFLTIIPRIFYQGKDDMLAQSFEEETFVARFQSLTFSGDEAPSFIVSGIINFGLWGIPLLACVYKAIITLMLWIAKKTRSNLFYCLVASLLLVQLQWGEINTVTFLESLRFVMLLTPLFLLPLVINYNENSLLRSN